MNGALILMCAVGVVCVFVTIACLVIAKRADQIATDFDRYDAIVATGIGGGGHKK